MRVLICGGGVIGAAIAYFLSRRGVEATVIERTGIACAASGKSGGFLALDWCDGTPLQRWRGAASRFMPACPTRSAAIGAIAASPPTAVSRARAAARVAAAATTSMGFG